ncbi:MAG: hypothetical protein AMXMBFR13_17380 [Phycisphaerae bacterium]
MYKLFLCLRYLRKRRIAFFAVAAVCLCVAMVLIVISVMGGFLQMVRDRSRGMLGDLIIENGTLQGFPYYAEFIEQIEAVMPEIHEATPVIITYGVLRFPRTEITKPVQVVGIRLEETYEVNEFKKGLFYEGYYPGTTRLAPQQWPRYGLNEDSQWVLPPELEAARKRWLETATSEEIAQAPRYGTGKYPGPGLYLPIPDDFAMTSTEPAWVGPKLPGIIIGTDLCAQRTEKGYDRYYYRGEPVSLGLLPFTWRGAPADATGVISQSLRYVDDCRTGVYDVDSMSVYVDFDWLAEVVDMDAGQLEIETGMDSWSTQPTEQGAGGKRLVPMPARATQIQIRLKPGAKPLVMRDMIHEAWVKFAEQRLAQLRRENPEVLAGVEKPMGWVDVQTWEQKQARYISAVEKEKYLVTALFGVISVVAVFLVGCIFYMIVQQKTRDIGIVKSVGATSGGVAGIFLGYGAAVGVVGGALGTLGGTLFVWYINEIQELLIWFSPRAQVWNPEIYAFDRIPNQVDGTDAAVIYGIAIVASMLGSLIAAWKAARVWPVESLRYE